MLTFALGFTEKMKSKIMKIHAAITGVSGYVPDYVLTNQELEQMVAQGAGFVWFRYKKTNYNPH